MCKTKFYSNIENKKTPICFPKKVLKIPSGTGKRSEEKEIPAKETPALANANSGIMPKATYGLIPCSIFTNKEKSFSFFLCGMVHASNTPAIVAWIPDYV